MERKLGKGGSGPCVHCGKEFARVLKHEPHCYKNNMRTVLEGMKVVMRVAGEDLAFGQPVVETSGV